MNRILPWSLQLFLGAICLLLPAGVAGQVQWQTWEDAQARNAREPRKFIVDVYTQWCGWCRKMDRSTFDDPEISEYINKHYYAVKFDAETKTDIQFKDKGYKYVRSGSTGYHELAAELTFGRMSFPTIVFLDEKLNVIQPIPGYKDPVQLDMIMRYFAEDYFKSMPWKKFSDLYTQGNLAPLPKTPPSPPKRD